MAKRRPAPTQDEIKAAIDAARKGKGRALAVMVKSFSVDDLAKGFSGARYSFSVDPYDAITGALSWASGRKSVRDDLNARMREVDKRVRREFKAKKAEALP